MAHRLAIAAAVFALGLSSVSASGQSPADLTDTEIAHVAYVADEIDIRYGHLALALSDHPDVRHFASMMVNDHSAVNEQALELLDELGVEPQDNFLSQQLEKDAEAIIDEMSQLRGAEFDRRYAENELAYHRAVIELVETAFIPNIETPEVKSFFETGLELFKAHEQHAQEMVEAVTQ